MKTNQLLIGLFIGLAVGVIVTYQLTEKYPYQVRLKKDINFEIDGWKNDSETIPQINGQIKKGSVGVILMQGPIIVWGKYSKVNFPVYLDASYFEIID